MSTPDFSKIWGSNSPRAPYEFSDTEYLQGWDFVGSTPPARTMFDAQMKQTDEKCKWLYDKANEQNDKFANYTETVYSPMFNKRDVITTSGTYTAPITGWYKITAKGGGGGGNVGHNASSNDSSSMTPSASYFTGSGGGEGATIIEYRRLAQGQSVSIVIGAGGTGAKASSDRLSVATNAKNGGTTSISLGTETLFCGGGKVGMNYTGGGGGTTGTIFGAAGGGALPQAWSTRTPGGVGGGQGGGVTTTPTGTSLDGGDGSQGGGGQGGGGTHNPIYYGYVLNGYNSGGDGGNGYVWLEYFDPSLNS